MRSRHEHFCCAIAIHKLDMYSFFGKYHQYVCRTSNTYVPLWKSMTSMFKTLKLPQILFFFFTTLLRGVLQYLVELKELLNLQSYFKSIVTFGLGLKSKLGTSFGLLSKRSLNSRYFYEMGKYIKLQNNHHRLYIHTIIIRKV